MQVDTPGKPRKLGTSGLRSSIRAIRWISQIVFLVVFIFLVTGTVCAAIVNRNLVVVEPLGAVQVVFAEGLSSLNLLTEKLIIGALVLVAFVILVGKAFCAWACPMGTLIDALDMILEKLRFRPFLARRPTNKKANPSGDIARNGSSYAVVASVITASALLRFPAWCAVCPIGTLCRGVLSEAEFVVGAQLAAVPAVAALSIGEKRFWCRYLCPVGGFLTLLSTLNPFIKPRIREDAERTDCGACQRICREGIDVCNEKSWARCTKCLDCYAKCPFGSVRMAWM